MVMVIKKLNFAVRNSQGSIQSILFHFFGGWVLLHQISASHMVTFQL
jgi:hypothetical protein